MYLENNLSLYIVGTRSFLTVAFVNRSHGQSSTRYFFLLQPVVGRERGNTSHRLSSRVIGFLEFLLLGKNAKSHGRQIGVGFVSSFGLNDKGVGDELKFGRLGVSKRC